MSGVFATESMSPFPSHGSECRARQPRLGAAQAPSAPRLLKRAPTRLRRASASQWRAEKEKSHRSDNEHAGEQNGADASGNESEHGRDRASHHGHPRRVRQPPALLAARVAEPRGAM